MTRRRVLIILLLALAFVVLLCPPATAQMPAEAQAAFAKADAYWTAQTGAPGPCAGQYSLTFSDGASKGYAATAAGAVIYGSRPEGLPDDQFPWPNHPTWRLVSCQIDFDIGSWDHNSSANRCTMLFHEVGHYYGRDHDEAAIWPIMNAVVPPEGVYFFEPCADLRTRIIVALGGRGGYNRPGWREVHCDPWEGRVLPCWVAVSEWNHQRIVRYRVRTRGDSFYIARVRMTAVRRKRSL